MKLSVLLGAREDAHQKSAMHYLEAGLYLIEENGGTFDQYIDYLTEFGYQ